MCVAKLNQGTLICFSTEKDSDGLLRSNQDLRKANPSPAGSMLQAAVNSLDSSDTRISSRGKRSVITGKVFACGGVVGIAIST